MNARACALLPLLAALVLTPAPARADGMVFAPPTFEAGEVRAVDVGPQRGLVWQRPDALEVWVEAVYAWEGAVDAGWVVPLPALPQVAEGDPRVLDDLDALTAPTFVRYCTSPRCDCDCDWAGCWTGSRSSGSDESLGPGDTPATTDDPAALVTVWSSGQVSGLDYQVVSAQAGGSVLAWLDGQGFALAPDVRAALQGMEDEGLFFFTARVAAPGAAGEGLPPIRLVFAPDLEPFYPVRLTAAALAPDAHLDVTLWLLSQQRLWPANVQTRSVAQAYTGTVHGYDYDLDAQGYQAALDEVLGIHLAGDAVVEYLAAATEARPWSGERDVVPAACSYPATGERVTTCADAWGTVLCQGESEGYTCEQLDPVSLASDLKAQIREAETPFVTRVTARLPARTRDAEWSYGPARADQPSILGVHPRRTGDCWPCPPCAGLFCTPTPERPTPPGVVLLTLLALAATLALLRRRVSRRRA